MNKKITVIIIALVISSFSCTKNEHNKPDTHKTNVIFIMSDDHAYQAISAYNTGLIETPNIDKIAEQGIKFNNAYVTNSLCAPSRAVILTGKFSHINGVIGNGQIFDGNQQTLPKILGENSYQTAIIGKWHLKSQPIGFDYFNVLPGQGDYYNPDFIKQGKDTTYQGYVTEIITDLSINWLNSIDKNKPFFLMMHHKAPHRNWMPALKNLELYNDKDFPFPANFYDDYKGREALKVQLLTVKNDMDIRLDDKVPCDTCYVAPVNHWAPEEYRKRMARLSKKELEVWNNSYKKEELEFYNVKNDESKFDQWKYRRFMEDYLRCIASVDESVGQVLNYLKENNLDQNTIIIYTSDQGFFLGEHGLFDKRFMYEEAMRTPLVIRYPKEIKEKSQTELLTQNIDIAPTILDVVGVPIPNEMQGESLRNIWNNEEMEWRDAIYYHYYEKGYGATPHYGIRTNQYKLIHFYDVVDSWEFYDLTKDPNEMKNLIDDVEYQLYISELKDKLDELRKKYQDTNSEPASTNKEVKFSD